MGKVKLSRVEDLCNFQHSDILGRSIVELWFQRWAQRQGTLWQTVAFRANWTPISVCCSMCFAYSACQCLASCALLRLCWLIGIFQSDLLTAILVAAPQQTAYNRGFEGSVVAPRPSWSFGAWLSSCVGCGANSSRQLGPQESTPSIGEDYAAHVLLEAVWHGDLRGGLYCIVSFQAVCVVTCCAFSLCLWWLHVSTTRMWDCYKTLSDSGQKYLLEQLLGHYRKRRACSDFGSSGPWVSLRVSQPWLPTNRLRTKPRRRLLPGGWELLARAIPTGASPANAGVAGLPDLIAACLWGRSPIRFFREGLDSS